MRAGAQTFYGGANGQVLFQLLVPQLNPAGNAYVYDAQGRPLSIYVKDGRNVPVFDFFGVAGANAPETLAVYDELRRRLQEVAVSALSRLPAGTGSTRAAPDAVERTHVLAVLDTYRLTSPEMVIFGRLIRDAMPATA